MRREKPKIINQVIIDGETVLFSSLNKEQREEIGIELGKRFFKSLGMKEVETKETVL